MLPRVMNILHVDVAKLAAVSVFKLLLIVWEGPAGFWNHQPSF